MSEDLMIKCLIAFVLGFLVARMARGNGLMVGGEESEPGALGGPCFNKTYEDGITKKTRFILPGRKYLGYPHSHVNRCEDLPSHESCEHYMVAETPDMTKWYDDPQAYNGKLYRCSGSYGPCKKERYSCSADTGILKTL